MITLERKKTRQPAPRAVVTPQESVSKAGPNADPMIWVLSALLTVIGIGVIFDAGFARAIQNGDGVIPTEFRSQIIFGIGSCFIAFFVSRVRGVVWQKYAGLVFGLAFLGLIAVKVMGVELNGATRWVKLGPITVQPAEFMKVAMIVFVAAALAARKPWKHPRTRDWAQYMDRVAVPKLKRLAPALLVALAAVFIEREPDLGTASVVGATAYFMFSLGGITRKSWVAVTLIGLVGVGAMIAKEPFRAERVSNHMHRWEADRIDDIGYQTVQSEIAMASGGLTGVGLGAGRVKHLMPAATTDFVFATVAEEVGFLGVMAILGLMGALVWRIWRLSQLCVNRFAQQVCAGVAIWLTLQTCVNLMMANGFLPPIGIPFPFISSGGSSLLAVLIGIALCQSVAPMREEEKLENRHHRRRNRRARLSRA